MRATAYQDVEASSKDAEDFKTGKPPRPLRPAWIEIDLGRLRRNFELLWNDKPPPLRVLSVVKDEAYGHGAAEVGRVAIACGAWGLGTVTLNEAMALRENGLEAPILVLGERTEEELPYCIHHRLTCVISDLATARRLGRLAMESGEAVPVHLKIDTGMSRYGVRWPEALAHLKALADTPGIRVEGVMSHFSMSDELDKSFALVQLDRFQQVMEKAAACGVRTGLRHLCNSGGFLDLPQAHFDLVRIGLLPLGVYPSKVCRRIPGIEPVMTVKSRICALRDLTIGDTVGYGMRYRASSPRRIAVVPMGYGDGFPRVRNEGAFLLHGRRVPIVGSVSMDAITIDVTEIPETALWDEVVAMGRQGAEEISVHEIAQLKKSVSYDVLTGWRARLPRVYLDGERSEP